MKKTGMSLTLTRIKTYWGKNDINHTSKQTNKLKTCVHFKFHIEIMDTEYNNKM